jgi:hypothetical protein
MTTDKHILRLLELRDSLDSTIKEMSEILQNNFPKEYSIAYQHWIPQINTALYNNTKWLPRGEHTFQDTINKITDSDNTGGIYQYIK